MMMFIRHLSSSKYDHHLVQAAANGPVCRCQIAISLARLQASARKSGCLESPLLLNISILLATR